MEFLPPTRPHLLKIAVELVQTPYLWGGKGEMVYAPKGAKIAPYFGLDCSGFITYSVYKLTGKDLRFTHNTDKMWQEWEEVSYEDVEPGDCAMYGGDTENDVDHVMMVLCVIGDVIVVVGACSGDSKTIDRKIAKDQDARVKVRASHLYRRDFRGFRRCPIA